MRLFREEKDQTDSLTHLQSAGGSWGQLRRSRGFKFVAKFASSSPPNMLVSGVRSKSAHGHLISGKDERNEVF